MEFVTSLVPNIEPEWLRTIGIMATLAVFAVLVFVWLAPKLVVRLANYPTVRRRAAGLRSKWPWWHRQLARFYRVSERPTHYLILFLSMLPRPIRWPALTTARTARLLAVAGARSVLFPVREFGLVIAYLWLRRVAKRARAKRLARQRSGGLPRLVWGPYPNLSILDIDRALRPQGLQMDSYVYYNFDRIWNGKQFTFVLTDEYPSSHWLMRSPFREVILYPRIFAHLLRNYDVMHGNFYEGWLRGSWLAKQELQLLHLAGCKRVSISVGGDVAVLTDIESHMIRQGYMDMYPEAGKVEAQAAIKELLEYYCRHSDLILCQNSYMIDALPRWDVLVNSYVPLDLMKWKSEHYTDNDGRNGPVVIGHSPNHRPLKGTNFLIQAVNELRAEGYWIELLLLEGMQNDEVRERLATADVIVADLVLQGYSLMAIEAMALGRPVIQDISDDHYNRVFKLYTPLGEAPFVSVPLEDLKENLRKLIENPQLRREYGRRGRAFVEKYHSDKAMAEFWLWLYDDVWHKRRTRVGFYHPDWPISTVASTYTAQLGSDQAALAERFHFIFKYQREKLADDRIGVYPVNPATLPTVEALVLGGALRSSDALVLDCAVDQAPTRCRHFPQPTITLETFIARGGKMLALLDNEAPIERDLANLDGKRYPLSVNDLLTFSYPTDDRPVAKPYRLLTLFYDKTTVPPLHFSNYAYIQHLKGMVAPSTRVLDICTGPGTVGLSLFSEACFARLDLVDVNPAAVERCRENIKRNFGENTPIAAHLSDVLSTFRANGGAGDPRYQWDLIIGNPPHNLDPNNIQPNLSRFDYVQAHDPDLEFHRCFFEQARFHLPAGGRICFLENGDVDCIQIEHLEGLLKRFREYRIVDWSFLPASQFYYVTIERLG